ncbi:MAG: sugar transferase [Actinomycetota bacterium]
MDDLVKAQPSARRHFISIGRLLIVNDVICVTAALVASWFLRFGAVRMPGEYLLLVAAAIPLWPLVFQSFSLYRPQHLAPEIEFRRVVTACVAGIFVLVLVSFWSKSSFSRGWIALALGTSVVLELSSRRLWRAYIAEQRILGRLALRTLVVGADPEALGTALVLSVEHGFEVVGLVSTEGDEVGSVASVAELPDFIPREEIDCVFVVPTGMTREDVSDVVGHGRRCGVEVRIISQIPQLLTSRLSIHPLGKAMTLVVVPPHLTRFQIALKRISDIVISATLLLLFAPLLLVLTFLIVVTSGRPVFFRQVRVTKGERTFHILKFRTMRTSTAEALEAAQMDPSAAFFKLGADDPNITPMGRFMRRWSLDELPQLFNVLKGDMSLVGPRPLPAEQVAAHRELLGARHDVLAGMTGWWQIRGRSDVGPEEAARMDIFYIENWSLLLDFYVLLKTLGVVFAKRGAY